MKPRKLIPVPIAVVLDLILGLLFACASLWFGIKQITIRNTALVLIGHSIDGRRWEFGPYFWTMHTTFLPLLLYLLVIVVCWIGKGFLSYREGYYARAREVDGLAMTASFLGYAAALLGLAGVVLGGAVVFKLLS